jgi:ribosomal protein S27AE
MTTTDATLTLFGEPPAAASLVLRPRPPWLRRTRAAAVLLGSWALMPLVFFVPPHAEWVIAVFFAGFYFARREWIAEYSVVRFEGACPRCHAVLRIREHATFRFPYDVACGRCRRTSTLQAGAPEAGAFVGGTTTHGHDQPPPEDLDVDGLREYWKRRSRSSVWSPASSDWAGWDRHRGK